MNNHFYNIAFGRIIDLNTGKAKGKAKTKPPPKFDGGFR